MVRQDDFTKSLLILECWRQGVSYGNHQIPMMILGCLTNRQKLGWGSYLDILKSLPKYSATIEQPNRDKWPDIWEPNFVRLLHAVDGVYDGSMPDPAMGGLFWADTKTVDNPWFKEKILGSALHPACANQNSFMIFR